MKLTLLFLSLLGALICFLMRRRDPIDVEAGVKIGQEEE